MTAADRASDATLLVSFASGLVMFAGSMGISPQESFAVMELDPAELGDPDAHIPARFPLRLIRFLEGRFPDEALGLRISQLLPASAMGVVLYAARNARTLADALDLWVRYTHVVSSHLVMTRSGAVLEYSHLPEMEAHPTIMDLALGVGARQVVALTGAADPIAWVALRHAAPSDPSAYHETFGPDVRFGQPRYAVGLREGLLDRPVVGADPALYRFIQQHLDNYARPNVEPADTSAAAIEAAIERAAAAGEYSVEAVADEANVSVRTLQRRARESGTTLSELMSRHREERARRLLVERRLSIDDVAFLLGYADERSFSRAFRRWTGHTPSAFRVQSSG